MNVNQIVSLDMPFGIVKKARIEQFIDAQTLVVTVLTGKYKNKQFNVNKMYAK